MSRPTQAGGETRVHLGLGSNLGNRKRNIERAVELSASGWKSSASPSSTRRRRCTKSANRPSSTPSASARRRPPPDLLRFIQEIEASMGRVPGPKNSPRPLDIDILLYGALALDEPDLVIPHPASPSGPSSSSPSPRSTPTPSIL